jgi:hypothetical protein
VVASGALLVKVIVLPVSAIVNPVEAAMVTPVEPEVFELIIDVVPLPAPTVRLPSLLTLPSTSVPVIVKLG